MICYTRSPDLLILIMLFFSFFFCRFTNYGTGLSRSTKRLNVSSKPKVLSFFYDLHFSPFVINFMFSDCICFDSMG